jgi:hypothetical protein
MQSRERARLGEQGIGALHFEGRGKSEEVRVKSEE